MTSAEQIHLQGQLRLRILGLHHRASSGHIGCSLSCIDIMISIMMYKQPADTFILSKGHAASALYSMLSETGDISEDMLGTFYKDGTTLPAHPAPLKHPAIPFATGSLGHGLPIAAGIAKANKLKKNDAISYVLMSDGETNEGTSWEAAHFAVASRLDNLLVVVDKNGLQGFGNTADILGDTASARVWEAIGFDVMTADGHNIQDLVDARKTLLNNRNGKPKLLIAQTVKGKGVPYMENRMEWHYLPMNEQLYTEAIAHIKEVYHL